MNDDPTDSGTVPIERKPQSRWAVPPGSASSKSSAPERTTASDKTRTSEKTGLIPTRHSEPLPEARHSRTGRSAVVTPDLGERREMRQADQAGFAPAAVLAGIGGVLVIVLACLVGALIDFLFNSRLGIFSGIGLTIGAFVAALITRKRDLLSVLIAPPLVYTAVALITMWLSPAGVTLTGAAELALTGFPAMTIATGVAALIIGIKLLTTRQGERR